MSDDQNETLQFEEIYPTLILPIDPPQSLSETMLPDEKYSGGVSTVSDLPRIDIVSSPNQHGEYRIIDELGRGGMGVVQLAEQRALGREVAVKSIVHDHSEVREGLLLEGRIMGMVEHPNVVPVHALGEDENGRPVIIMKRIAGDAWDEVIERPDDDALGRDLRILLQVCQALGFSHSIGIIHRDIKPANVMVGEFGEVYLVDWGLALAIDDRYPNIPQTDRAHTIVGTPAYIAPEMTIGDGTKLGTWTDIYLMGAILFHIIAGRAPHTGANLFETLRCSYEGTPRDYPDGAPPEICSLCEKALATDPADRWSDIGEFQNAIEAFIEHRGSRELTRNAIDLLDEIEPLVAQDRDEAQIYPQFTEARFTLRNAIEVWEENHAAIAGLDRGLHFMTDYELRRDDPVAAKKLAADLSTPNADLNARIELAISEVEKRQEKFVELEKLEHDVDANVGSRSRVMPLVMLGFGFSLVILFPQYAEWFDVSIHDVYLAHIILMFIPLFVVRTVFRPIFYSNFANRVLAKGVWMLWVGTLFTRVIVVATDTSISVGLAFECLICAVGTAQMMLAIDRRLFVAAIVFGLGAFAVAPSDVPWIYYGLTGILANLGLGVSYLFLRTESFADVDLRKLLVGEERGTDVDS